MKDAINLHSGKCRNPLSWTIAPSLCESPLNSPFAIYCLNILKPVTELIYSSPPSLGRHSLRPSCLYKRSRNI